MALNVIEDEKKRPKQSHKKYRHFAIAVREGCFVCNALDEPLTKEKARYTLPLFKYWTDNPDPDGRDMEVYKYRILEISDKQPGCYTRAGLGQYR